MSKSQKMTLEEQLMLARQLQTEFTAPRSRGSSRPPSRSKGATQGSKPQGDRRPEARSESRAVSRGFTEPTLHPQARSKSVTSSKSLAPSMPHPQLRNHASNVSSASGLASSRYAPVGFSVASKDTSTLDSSFTPTIDKLSHRDRLPPVVSADHKGNDATEQALVCSTADDEDLTWVHDDEDLLTGVPLERTVYTIEEGEDLMDLDTPMLRASTGRASNSEARRAHAPDYNNREAGETSATGVRQLGLSSSRWA